MTTLPAVNNTESVKTAKKKKKKGTVRIGLPDLDTDNRPQNQELNKVFPTTPHPSKLQHTQSPRSRRIRPRSSKSPRRKRPTSAKILTSASARKRPKSAKKRPQTVEDVQTPNRPAARPPKNASPSKNARKHKKKIEQPPEDEAPAPVKKLARAEKCGGYFYIGVLNAVHCGKGKGKVVEDELLGSALRKFQAKEDMLQKFDARGMIDSTDLNVTQPTFTDDDLSLDGCDVPGLSTSMKDEYMRKCDLIDSVITQTDESLAAKLRALEGKPDYRTREALERFGVKLRGLHNRLRGDQAIAFAQVV